MRLEGGERIRRNFWAGRRNSRNERGLAGVGETDEAHVRKELQFEAQVSLFTDLAVLVFARSLMPRANEMGIAVATPTATAAGGQKSLAGVGEIEQLFAAVRVEDDRAHRNAENCRFAGTAVAF